MAGTVLLSAPLAAAPKRAAAPAAAAKADPHPAAVDFYHKVKVVDRWRWLEDPKDPDTVAWLAAQNAKSRAWLDAVADRPAIAEQLKWIELNRSTAIGGIKPAGDSLFAFLIEPGAQQPKITRMALSGDPASRKTVFDPLSVAVDGSVAVDWFEPSPDGSKLAISLSANGSEDGTLHVYDVATGKEIEAPVPHVQYPTAGGSLAWTADGQGYWYTRFPGEEEPEAERHFNQAVWFHKLGADHRTDVRVLDADDGVPRTGEIFLSNPEGSARALASVQLGDGGEWQHFLLDGEKAQKALAYEAKVKSATLARDGTVFGISTKDSLNGAVVRLDPGAAAPAVIVPAGDLALTTPVGEAGIVLSGDRLFYAGIDGGPTKLISATRDGKSVVGIDTPPVSSVSDLVPLAGGDLLYRVRTYLVPTAYFRFDATSGRSSPTPIRQSTAVDLSNYSVSRIYATSKDGTKVPVTLIEPTGARHDGTMPTVLYGYGGYGVNLTPGLIPPMAMLVLRAGGAWAIANIRGGGEYGDRWHQEGMLTKKQNVFDDFYAAAEMLKTQKVTSTPKLALMGGSNGGLLMGATLTQHPTVAKAVVSEVGIYDMLRVELDPNGSFNVTEFGTIKDPDQFAALYAYSPYHHVRAGVQYPAILMTTGDNDGRVNPLHSRKFTAALQATGTRAPVLLRTSAKAGHGQGSSLDEQIALTSDVEAFLFRELGLKLVPVH